MKPKIVRSRTGCVTCKRRRRKCDEAKPACLNCASSGRDCEGYVRKLIFDVDDSRKDMRGGFRGRPRKVPDECKDKGDDVERSMMVKMEKTDSNGEDGSDNGLAVELVRDGSLQSLVSSEECDFSDEKQFETAILSGLDYILDNYDTDLLLGNNGIISPVDDTAQTVTPNYSEVDSNVDSNAVPKLKKKEESHILKHFFSKVIFLLDAHPQNPWPELMVKFGDVDLAKSCFLSLSSMHLYINNGGDEFYKKGLMHINNTMEYLIKYVKSSDPDINIPNIISKIKVEANKKVEKNKNFMVILLLLYVHLLFAILESGRSALSRMFLKLAASIADDPTFHKQLQKIKQSQYLLCVLCWWDTVSSLVSPDCRVPYHSSRWFGKPQEMISTDQMSGCAVGTFTTLYDLSLFRNETMTLFSQKNVDIDVIKLSYETLIDIKFRFTHYRDHVLLELPTGSAFTYIDRLKCAQLWSIAGILQTIQLEVHYFGSYNKWLADNMTVIGSSDLPTNIPTTHSYNDQSTALVTEFLAVYNTLPSDSPIVTQMVWPLFYTAVCAYTPDNRQVAWAGLEILYETVKMGTIRSVMDIVQDVWTSHRCVENVLSGAGWFENGIDLLPC